MSKTIRSFIYLGILVAIFGVSTRAQTINAADCSSSAVQSALNSVSADGTTVVIPSCAPTNWTTTVTYNQKYSTTIEGQSMVSGECSPQNPSCGAVDNTVLVDALSRGASCGSPDNGMLQLNAAPGKSLRLTGITFQFAGGQTCGGSIRIDGTTTSLRVDHNHFYKQWSTGLAIQGNVTGVIDHNFFEAPSGIWNGIKFQEGNWGGNDALGVGDQSWASPTNFGSSGFVFVENNEFHTTDSGSASSYADDCTDGGRWVWRYNLMIGTNAGINLQTHPTGGGQRHRGCRAEVIYGNDFQGGGTSSTFNGFFLSSGTALIWGNTVNAAYQNFVTLHSMRRDNTTYTQGPTPNGWGYCGTSFSGTGSGWDENSNSSTGYRCLDQPGEGQGDLLVNDFPNTVDSSTGGITWPNEKLEPVYEWLNTSSAPSFWNNYEPDAIFANADYYLYTGSFTGASGVGAGTLASRPSTCTTGVAYWATDQGNWNQSGNGTGQGELFVCTATNTWSLYYQPYTYPHPLVTGQGSQGSGSPAAPTGLSASVQ